MRGKNRVDLDGKKTRGNDAIKDILHISSFFFDRKGEKSHENRKRSSRAD